ncbi:MAG: CopG family antitoxin [bacterium]
MKYFELDKKEKEIIKAFDKGEFKSIAKLHIAKARYKKYAETFLNKTKNINIRLSEKDLRKMKSKAMSKGMPYQTLVNSIIHQYANED